MIRLHLPFPISVNALYANGGNKRGRHKTPRYEAWIAEASIVVKDSMRQRLGPYSISICLQAPDKRARDIGNLEKCVSDFLVMHGIVKDDSFCQRLLMTWGEGLPAPCVVLLQKAEEDLAA
ncbi:RusA family crossover junction endodeoxyribonuclease [Rhizobium ecuadorense]|uniref:RusA family crossover junction endodeoxyribonuclease n=1 Tax=Rhizobium ecuadorense TaxID=1671795 RepID=UPI0006738C34|nr:RusA family crossover junction endodeoxyribonuclease [Rhizobium ecuadorense]